MTSGRQLDANVILVDPRAGSANYIQPLKSLGAVVEIATLPYGDCAFVAAQSGMVGIELKTLGDVLNCIDSGRFAGHQLPGLIHHYDAAYLIIEGLWRPHPEDGSLETWSHGKWASQRLGRRMRLYRELDNWLTTMELLGGVHIRRSGSPHETARLVFDLYDWYAREDEHRSHLALDGTTQDALEAHIAKERRKGRGAMLFREPPTPARVVASCLPRIGVEKSGMVAGAFPTVKRLVNATDAEWLKLPGIGKGIVAQIKTWIGEE